MLTRIALPASVTAALLLSSCGAPAPIQAVHAEIGTIASTLTYTASVQPQWSVSLVPTSAGKIVSLNVKLGQAVSQGADIAELDSRPLQDAVTQAQADVAGAQAKLDSLQAGPRAEDVAVAQANAAAAEAAVADLSKGRPEAIVQAQANLDAATQKLAAAQAGGRPESVQQAQAKLNADQAALDKLRNGPTAQDVGSARLVVEQAKDKLFADQTQDDALVGQGLMTKASRQAALDVDQTAIEQANAQLLKLLAPPRPEDITQAQALVTADQQALAIARQPNRPEDLAQLAASVAAAQAQLDQARQPGSAGAIAQAQQQANAQWALAAKAATPYTAQDIAQVEAALQSALATLQSARTTLANATITAPAAGVISDVSVAVGSLASPTSPVVTEVAADVEADASVAQDQIARFSQGQAATILAGCQTIPGHVFALAPTADPKTSTFAVKVVPDSRSDSLRAGMSVTVQIRTGQVENAIVVPTSAVQTRNGQQMVLEAVDGKARAMPVQTGLTTSDQVQVTAGVQVDDLVLLPGATRIADGDPVLVAASQAPTVPSAPSASAGTEAPPSSCTAGPARST